MRKSYKFKLYSTKKTMELQGQLHVACGIYNHFIALSRRYYRLYKKSLSKYQAQKHLTKIKKLEKYAWMKVLGSQAAQEVIERIDKGYKKFFQDLKKKLKTSKPKFKPTSKYKSFTLKQAGYSLLEGNRVKIGKKVYKYSKSREIQGEVKTLTIKRDQVGDWWLIFSCEVEDLHTRPNSKTGKRAGFDFGLSTFLTTSEGKEVKAPLYFLKSLKQLKKASKNLSRKKKGSSNRRKARQSLARLHRRVENQRRDFHFKLARELVNEFDYLFFEDLSIKGMSSLWGRKIQDLGFSSFMSILEYQCEKYGAKLHKISRWFPSTQTCSSCNKVREEKLRLDQRKWECTCGAIHGRDYNAAINIEREGASSLGLCDSKPAPWPEAETAVSNSRIPLL